MNFRLLVVTLFCVICISVGQILFKKSALSMTDAASWESWIFNVWLIAALALYGATTLLWIWILRHVSLHVAYPFMGLAFLFVPIMERIFFNEPLRTQTIIGGLLILLGVSVASRVP